MEIEVTGDLVWPWHSWQLAFRYQCKGLRKVAIVPSGTSILLFLHFEDLKSLFCCINCCSFLMWKYQECWASISLLCWRLFFHRARSIPRARPLLTAEAAWQLHIQALTEPQIPVTPHRLETQKFSQIYFQLNVVPPVLPCVTNTRSLTHGWEAGLWRQYPHVMGGCSNFFLEQRFMCAALN